MAMAGEEFCAVVGSICFEASVDGMKHFAGYGGKGLELGFVACQQFQIEGLEMGIEARGAQRGHVERLAEIAIALAADARGLVDRGAGSLMSRIEAAVGHPLAHR